VTCPVCHGPGPSWRSTAAGLAVEGCADCHRRWRGHVLAGMADAAGRTHTAARLRGQWCSGPCAACEAERRAEVAA